MKASNNNSNVEKTKFFSYKKENLADGCKYCIKGEKSVLYITGICPRNCFFCPTSEKKKNKDVKYINEQKFETDKEMIEEIKLSKSKGVGITGGDPLARLDRTVNAIKLLKKTFGKKFHIHLYTSPDLVTKEALTKLHTAGLDEIRFHPDLENDKLWNKILLAKEKSFKWLVGIEIPTIPDKEKETIKLIEKFNEVVDYFNFNELEISDLNADEFIKRKYFPKDNISYAVTNSQKLGLKLLKIAKRGHFCTCKLKDRIQLGNRIIKRAESVMKNYDSITDEGMLVRGAIYINVVPVKPYAQLLKNINSKKEITLLEKLKNELIKTYRVPKNLIDIDKTKLRLLTTTGVVESLSKELKEKGNKYAVVTEYPTSDNMEVELEFLN
ncbi:MAG: radical SAM protein [Candidatus Woesearchaeota archaeon]|jgi:hypothetical protein